jgi:hypothetical protein
MCPSVLTAVGLFTCLSDYLVAYMCLSVCLSGTYTCQSVNLSVYLGLKPVCLTTWCLHVSVRLPGTVTSLYTCLFPCLSTWYLNL